MTQFDDVCQEQQDKAQKVLLYLKESVGVNSEGYVLYVYTCTCTLHVHLLNNVGYSLLYQYYKSWKGGLVYINRRNMSTIHLPPLYDTTIDMAYET